MLYVVAVAVVPIALMCLMLIMERLERRVLGETEAPAAAPQTATAEPEVVVEPPKAA